MSEGKNFSRRRRGGMRFRPSPQAQKKFTETKADATLETQGANQRVFDKSRQSEIERAENVAAGLPPEGIPRSEAAEAGEGKKAYREPHLDTPEEVKEEFKPIEFEEKPKGLMDAIKIAAAKVIKKVQRLIKPVKPPVPTEINACRPWYDFSCCNFCARIFSSFEALGAAKSFPK